MTQQSEIRQTEKASRKAGRRTTQALLRDARSSYSCPAANDKFQSVIYALP
jgi:hypothetical protein